MRSVQAFVGAHRPKLALLLVSVIWGATFPLGKYVIGFVPVFTYLGLRFFLASGVLFFVGRAQLRGAGRRDWGVAFAIGVCLFASFAFQTVGLSYTTAAKTSFATGMYVVFVPFLYFALFRTPLRWPAALAGILGAFGMALLGGDFSGLLDWDFGVTLVLVSGLFAALQIIGVARYARRINPTLLTFAQLLISAVLFSLIALAREDFPASVSPAVWLSIVFLAVFATVGAYFIQCREQQYVGHTATAVILSMECVFGALLSWMFLGEAFTLQMFAGGVLLVAAMLIAQKEPPPVQSACSRYEVV